MRSLALGVFLFVIWPASCARFQIQELTTICHVEEKDGTLTPQTWRLRMDTAKEHMKKHKRDYWGHC